MTIKCDTLEDMIEIIHGLVVNGLTFEADTASLIVTLTGGY